MKRSWLAWMILATLPGSLVGQGPTITSDTAVDSDTLHGWLASGDPRLIAWAADFARRRHDGKVLGEMRELLVHSSLPLSYGNAEGSSAMGDALGAILDALIQTNAQVPVRAIRVVAPFFPAQAAILISRLPLSESRETLEDWTFESTGPWGGRTLARIAAMMLAKDPVPSQGVWDGQVMGFVASVVEASEEELRVTVRSENYGGGGGSGTCGDSMGSMASLGWPPIYAYDLVENYSDRTTPLVVDLDGDRIAFLRREEHAAWGSCNGVAWLDSSTRHRLIAHWLGVQDSQMPWQAVESFTIVWTDNAAYQRRLGEIVESERQKLRATVKALYERGLITEGEASLCAPRLSVKIQCAIKPCPLP